MSFELMASAGPQPRVSEALPYEVFAFRTRSGEVVRRIPAKEPPRWEEGLNLMGSWSVSVALDDAYLTKEELSGVTDSWDWSWAICQGPKIWQAGPVLGERYSGGSQTEIYGVGIWQMLADQRQAFNPARAAVDIIKVPDADIPFGTGATSTLGTPIHALNQNLNLRGVARRLIQLLLTEPGGDLPIDVPSLTDGTTWSGTVARDFPGYETASWGERLLSLTQFVDGPETQFRPYFTTLDKKFIRFQTVLGSPRLGQLGAKHVWRSGSGLVALPFTMDGVRKVRRYWERGAGSDRNIITAMAQNLDGVTTGPTAGLLPLLEQVSNSNNSEGSASVLSSYATTGLISNKHGSLTLQPEVLISGSDGHGQRTGSPPLWEVSPGDAAVLQVVRHPRLPDGNYPVRIVRMSGLSAKTATLDVSIP